MVMVVKYFYLSSLLKCVSYLTAKLSHGQCICLKIFIYKMYYHWIFNHEKSFSCLEILMSLWQTIFIITNQKKQKYIWNTISERDLGTPLYHYVQPIRQQKNLQKDAWYSIVQNILTKLYLSLSSSLSIISVV